VLLGAIAFEVKVDVDGCYSNVGGMSAASLNELCHGGKLLFCRRRGNVAGVEQQAEEGGFA